MIFQRVLLRRFPSLALASQFLIVSANGVPRSCSRCVCGRDREREREGGRLWEGEMRHKVRAIVVALLVDVENPETKTGLSYHDR